MGVQKLHAPIAQDQAGAGVKDNASETLRSTWYGMDEMKRPPCPVPVLGLLSREDAVSGSVLTEDSYLPVLRTPVLRSVGASSLIFGAHL